jgi:hypothetical protein
MFYVSFFGLQHTIVLRKHYFMSSPVHANSTLVMFCLPTRKGDRTCKSQGLESFEGDMDAQPRQPHTSSHASLPSQVSVCALVSCLQVLVSSRHGPLVRCCGKFPWQGDVPFETGNGVEVVRAQREGEREGGGERRASYDDCFLSNTIKQWFIRKI